MGGLSVGVFIRLLRSVLRPLRLRQSVWLRQSVQLANPYSYSRYGSPATGYPAYPRASGYPPPSNYPPSNYPPSAYPADRQGPQGSIGVRPGQTNTGGLSFEITPNTAQLFVDGALVGTVGQFTPTTQPLGLVAGRHQIEVRAPGYQTMSFEVDIVGGQVIPYQGALER